jgi:hypothetical protein
VNGTLSVMFAPAGQCDDGPGHQVLQPLNPDGSDVFQRNRTIPVKFRVCDVNGVSIGAPNVVSSFLLRQIIRGTVTTDVSIAPESTNHDTGFRLDGGDRRWMFNLSTKNLESGATYGYRIALVDGSAIEFRFTLR